MASLNDKTSRSRGLRKAMSPPEIILWRAISRNRLGYTVNRQKPFGPYFLDFYIARLKVAIEVDGKVHEVTYEHDHKRDAWLNSKGIIVIRISARSIFENIHDVVTYLQYRVDEIAAQSGSQDYIPPQE